MKIFTKEQIEKMGIAEMLFAYAESYYETMEGTPDIGEENFGTLGPMLIDKYEKLEEALRRIVTWSEAYPIDMFIPPTKEELKLANEILADNGISFSAINASTMKHVVSGVGEIARKALNEGR